MIKKKISPSEILADGVVFQWVALEKRKRKGNYWSQRIECRKTGIQTIREGTHKTKKR